MTVDRLSVHLGDHRGSLWISLDAGMTLCVWRRMSLFSRDTSWSIYEWSFVMFSTHLKRCRKKMRERESECGTQAKSIWIRLNCAILYLLYRFEHFQEKNQRQKSSGKNLSAKNVVSCVCPLPVAHVTCFQCILLLNLVHTSKRKNKCRYCCFWVYNFRSI